jgi:acyl carrier protein
MSVEETLKKIVTRVTRKPETAFSRETTFEDLDADSLDIVQVLVALEDTYDIEIQEEELQEIKNMGDFITYIERKAGEKGK